MVDRTTITISDEQHERLKDVKEHLKIQASEDLNLAQTGYEPSMVDALGYLFSMAEKAWELEQEEEEEDDVWYKQDAVDE